MQMTEAQQIDYFYGLFLKASKEADRRAQGQQGESLLLHMAEWKNGLFLDSIRKVAQRPTSKPSIKERLLGRL